MKKNKCLKCGIEMVVKKVEKDIMTSIPTMIFKCPHCGEELPVNMKTERDTLEPNSIDEGLIDVILKVFKRFAQSVPQQAGLLTLTYFTAISQSPTDQITEDAWNDMDDRPDKPDPTVQ